MRRDENEELGGDPTPANNFTNRPLQWLQGVYVIGYRPTGTPRVYANEREKQCWITIKMQNI